MFSFRAAIFFLFVSSNRAYSFYDEFSSESYASPRADICLSSGTQCSEDCSAVLFCTGAGATPIMSVNCTQSTPSQFCSFDVIAVVAQCSATSDCRAPADRLPIQCREAGNFPDPYDCRNSYTCESNNPDPVDQCKCLPGEIWIGPSLECVTNPDNDTILAVCQDAVDGVDCSGGNIGGNLGGVPIREGYYYICERGSGNPTISLHKCPDGQIWNNVASRCENRSIALLKAYNEAITHEEKLVRALPVCESNLTTTTTNSTDTTTTPFPTPIPPVCSFSGQIIPITGDCQQYWVCDPNLQPVLRSCVNGTYLDCSWNGCYCVVGNCTNPPLVSDCSFVGQIIQMPGDCQSYWVCDANLDPQIRSCDNGTYLDCSVNGCYCLVGTCPNQPVQLWIDYDDE